jgi:hypothetical protein
MRIRGESIDPVFDSQVTQRSTLLWRFFKPAQKGISRGSNLLYPSYNTYCKSQSPWPPKRPTLLEDIQEVFRYQKIFMNCTMVVSFVSSPTCRSSSIHRTATDHADHA